ncbi:hypothetical protein MY3296_001672 [Beauveria thailandica]
MNAATDFYRSQVGGTGVINYSYTDFPWRLFLKDVYYFFVYCWALPWVVLPLTPTDSGELDELYPSWANLQCLAVHTILILLQLFFFFGLLVAVLLPVWLGAVFVGGCLFLNWLLCLLLNGKGMTFHSDEKYAKALPQHQHEQWIFLNGVAAGEHWMKNNLNRLAITFGRPVLGIHNRTSGIIFDVIECLVQRNFSYATNDVRVCYKVVRDVLYDPSKTKVIFIMHSQGGIEGGLVLDWLLQEMPQNLLSKLEVYTFGNAANHFNNPHRHVESQSLTIEKPREALATLVTETSFSNMHVDTLIDAGDGKAPSLVTQSSSMSASSRSWNAAQDRAIGYIEHFAHTTDFVALWGVLHFATNKMGSPQLPRFMGRLFSRSTRRGGHQFNQHYLDGMFPLERDPHTGELIGAAEKNEFMEETIKIGKEGAGMENTREAFDITYKGTMGFGSGDISTPVEVHGALNKNKLVQEYKVKDVCRLWSYRNGRCPQDTTSVMGAEAIMARTTTIQRACCSDNFAKRVEE